MKNNLDILDCMGDMCPIPMIKIENKMNSIKPGDEFMLVSDHSCTLSSIQDKYHSKITKIDEVLVGVWEVYFKK